MSNAAEKPKYVSVLLQLMGERNESQNDLAKAIGTNRDKVNNWIAARSKLDIENLIKIAEHYNVTTDYLLGETTVRKQDATIRSIEEYTGLSSEAITNIVALRNDSMTLGLLLDLLESPSWLKGISKYLRCAVDALHIFDANRVSADNTQDLLHIQSVLAECGESLQLGPDAPLPKGTVLLPAYQAIGFYKTEAMGVFSQFLDDIISSAWHNVGGLQHGKH